VIQNLYDEFKTRILIPLLEAVVGGFTAFHLANSLGICALLYNPALHIEFY
jgi:predicted esterase YcpF (UPF0227 family)